MGTRRLVLASGLRLVVRDYGSGVPVLLVHAWGEIHRSFDGLVPLLLPHLRLIVPDQRGVGDSDKPVDGYPLGQAAADLVELLHALDLNRSLWWVRRVAGYIAQQIGVDHAKRVDGLVLVGSPAASLVAATHSARYWPTCTTR
jgi:pimeloyl-ACP methyl ester carboxylesterase